MRAARTRLASPGAAGAVSLVESAYSVDLPYRSWALGLLRSMQGAIASDLGGFLCLWERSGHGAPTLTFDSLVATGVAEQNAPLILGELTKAPGHWLNSVLDSVPALGLCALTSELDPRGSLSYRSNLRADGIADGVNLIAQDLHERGLLVSLATPGQRRMTATLRRDLTTAVTHILAGLRLRARMSAVGNADPAPGVPPEAEAILSPDGRLVHARGKAKVAAARLSLERAVRTIERARAGLFDTPDGGLRRWRGLVAARWSLVDSFERDGRRYVVACENRPLTPGIHGLTRTERNVVAYAARGLTTKEMAYVLGLSPSTVRVLMMRAARRCGLKSRRELLEAWARRAVAPAPTP